MEKNCIKTNIFTNETILNERLEQAVDADFSLPDYCPDIGRVLKCRAVPRIALKNVNGRTVTVDGSVTITVFYSDESGKINSYEYVYPFEKVKDIDTDIEEDKLTVKAKCEYMNCRAVTTRKLDVHGAIGITLIVKRKKPTEIIADIDDADIEILRGISPATTPTDFAEKSLVIEEETELPSGEKANMLLRYDADVSVKESKILSGKVIIKGEMQLVVKYLAEENIKSVKTVIPFSQVLDIKTTGESCECSASAEICFLDIKPICDNDGYFEAVTVNAKVLICAETYCKNDIAVILDAYSKKKNAEIVKNNIYFEQLIKNVNDTFGVKGTVTLNDFDISAVVDSWYDVLINETKVSGDNLLISGVLSVSLIAEDTDKNTSYFEKAVEFTYKYPLENLSDNLRFEPKITVSSFGYTITGAENVEIRAELSVVTPIYEKNEMNAVTDISVFEDQNKRNKSDIAMVVYFAEKGEKIWDIGLKYLASCEEIKAVNNLTEESLLEDMMVLIPIG